MNYTSPQCDNGAVGGWFPSTPVSRLSALDTERQGYFLLKEKHLQTFKGTHKRLHYFPGTYHPNPFVVI